MRIIVRVVLIDVCWSQRHVRFRVQGLTFRAYGFEVYVLDLYAGVKGFKVQGLRLRCQTGFEPGSESALEHARMGKPKPRKPSTLI